jgi:hypothetical protein
MRPGADLQARFARVVVYGDFAAVAAEVVGGRRPLTRLAIHHRHYETSLVRALLQKFPASASLVGVESVTRAAHIYVRAEPPRRPCIAEYGQSFPEFLRRTDGLPPYLAALGELEWAVGRASIAIEAPPLLWEDVVRAGVERLLDSSLALQPGLRYVRSRWAVDELMTAYLNGSEIAATVPVERDSCIEVRGSRGDLSLRRLDSAAYAFRAALADGRSIGAAADAVLDSDAAFDAGSALREIVGSGLVVGLSEGPAGGDT